ncbi:MAG TPA: formylglycine-generating enzyme family protein [Aggregatilineales bacterium]|nr:formylglycine-generating enzyme family protein [Aggregatilineales bacterium]
MARNQDWTPVVQTIKGYEMVEVPPGCFQMGSEDGRRDERPVSKVCFVSPFWLDRNAIDNTQFGSVSVYAGPKQPHTNLTWFEARDFCKNRGVRLPTEAEWEYAARGPDGLIYPWGNTLVAANLSYDRNMGNNTEPAEVGSHPTGASWVGAYDMTGNVWEWVSSLYKPYPYSPTDGRENDGDTTSARSYRSGWLSYNDHGVSTTIRFYKKPSDRDWHLGFRCAMSNS